jgi:hypothetical protein
VAKRNCWSRDLASCLKGKKLPIAVSQSVELARAARDAEIAGQA